MAVEGPSLIEDHAIGYIKEKTVATSSDNGIRKAKRNRRVKLINTRSYRKFFSL